MTNIIALDVALGLIFIFLLYSLLATSIKEGIASMLSLRARMLKKGIIKGMLSDTSDDNRWLSIWKGIVGYAVSFIHFFSGRTSKPGEKTTLGDKFYDHSLIKSYGANRVYPTPSYIPATNFSAVLLDVLRSEFAARVDEIAAYKLKQTSNQSSLAEITLSLKTSQDINQIKELLDYYQAFYTSSIPPVIQNPAISRDTSKILFMNLRDCVYNIEAFSKRMQDWFNDTMERVSGWYKRQVQTILFIIGLIMAIVFNVDVIKITERLSKDKDARDKMVQLAVQANDTYKDDPRVKKTEKPDSITQTKDSANNQAVFDEYNSNLSEAKTLLNQDIKNANDLLAGGWAGFGRKEDSTEILSYYDNDVQALKKILSLDTTVLKTTDSVRIRKRLALLNTSDSTAVRNLARMLKTSDSTTVLNKIALDSLYDHHWIKLKVGYVLKSSLRPRKMLGFFLLALAVCLGAPFWFDLLNKFVNLRAAGTKDDGNDKKKKSPKSAPVTVNINTNQTKEEAVG